MYRAFKLEPFKCDEELCNEGKILFEKNSEFITEELNNFISGGTIDGTRLRDFWFPKIDAQVFISHSSKDTPQAYCLSAWLKNEFNLDCFVDSSVWGYSNTLLRMIDDKYCYKTNTKSYNYNLRNSTTSHVHMMLATALSRMLDNTECAIFLSTPNSISHSNGRGPELNSPWIYYELTQMAVLREKIPARIEIIKEGGIKQFSKKSADIPIKYSASFDSLTPIHIDFFNEWRKRWIEPTPEFPSPLDCLYELAPHPYL